MHAVLSLTMMHDRFLSTTPQTKLSTTEAFHWHQSTALFNRKIEEPIHPSDRDALWATTILLGNLTFYHVDAASPEEAWPLRQSSPLDLNWLRMSDGKQEIWKLSQPLRDDSVWQVSARNYLSFLQVQPSATALGALPSAFIELCELNDFSDISRNPYYDAALSLGQSINNEDALTVIMNFIAFTTNMKLDYKRLLQQKDARALLILACWYAKVCQYQLWWIQGRVAMECRAICIYLERYHAHDAAIQELLLQPIMMIRSIGAKSLSGR